MSDNISTKKEKKIMKVVRIEENGKCYLFDWEPGSKLNGQHVDHETLFGLEHKGLKLGIFGLEWTNDHPPCNDMMKQWDEIAKKKYNTYNINKLAMKILKKLKYYDRIIDYPYPVKGPVLLYDDDTDMTKDKWNIIRNFMKNKSNNKK